VKSHNKANESSKKKKIFLQHPKKFFKK